MAERKKIVVQNGTIAVTVSFTTVSLPTRSQIVRFQCHAMKILNAKQYKQRVISFDSVIAQSIQFRCHSHVI